MRTSFLPFSPPLIGEEEIEEVVATLRSQWISTGPKVLRFEGEFAKFVGAPAALGVSSCSAALHLALLALGIGPGDQVITTPMTFASTVHAIEHVGASAVLVDVEPATLNIDASRVASALRKARRTEKANLGETKRRRSGRGAKREQPAAGRIRAILPVHLYGQPCDLDSLFALACEHSLDIVEDAAHSLPATYKGRLVGSVAVPPRCSNLVCFSFYATKNLTTGEGGMLTGPHELLHEARLWSEQGISRSALQRYNGRNSWRYDVLCPGFKFNMTDIQAAIGLHQLKKLFAFWARRREIAAHYNHAFSHLEELQIPFEGPGTEHAWHLYALRLRLSRLRISRDEFLEQLKARNIGASVHFIPVHLHPYYRDKYGFRPEDFPVALGEYQRIISLPLNLRMTDADVVDVIEAVGDIVARYRLQAAIFPWKQTGEKQPAASFPDPEAGGGPEKQGIRHSGCHSTPLHLWPLDCDFFLEKVALGALEQTYLRQLLGREPFRFDADLIRQGVQARRVLVTGAAGSLGFEICRQLLAFQPALVILYDRAESNLHTAALELRRHLGHEKVIPILGDIMDKRKIQQSMEMYAPDVVCHAAAYKHVPLMEDFPLEAMENNIFSAETVALVARRSRVKKFVYISTDKAVRPAGVMGMTKCVAEHLLLTLNGDSTKFIAVRFGNLLASAGSAVSVFLRQICAGGPVTITHPEATRQFLLLSEAAQLVLLAAAAGQGGEIFILDTAKPVRIVDLAENLIRLFGLQPGEQIPLEIVGLRAGEKLHEDLAEEMEAIVPAHRAPVFVAHNRLAGAARFRGELERLRELVARRDREAAIAQLKAMTARS